MSKQWISRPKPQHDPRLRLFCLPHAGGGASLYLPWGQSLSTDIEVCPIQLPGREGRISEPPIQELPELIRALASAITPLLDTRFALLGHSLGALLAFELTRELRRRGLPAPARLFLSGRKPPNVPSTEPMLHRLPDTHFLDQLQRRYNGIPQALLDEPELMTLLLPTIRADFTLLERYSYAPEPPLDCPFTVLYGRDDPLVHADDVHGWRELTAADFAIRVLPGGHFYLHDDRKAFLAVLATCLAPILR